MSLLFRLSRRSGARSETQNCRSKSSAVNSTLRSIDLNKPGPMTSPECTGTTVALPSACLRKTWLPRVRTDWNPIALRIRRTSFPVIRGRRVILKFVERQSIRAKQRRRVPPPGTRQLPHELSSSVCQGSSPVYDNPASPERLRHSNSLRPVR